jgi:tetratricopeptide (TPR) repeat protein
MNRSQNEPEDPFNLYALATEYRSLDTARALQYFELLAREHPSYVPTYYHLAALYDELDMPSKAKMTYIRGIEEAGKQSEHLLLRELKSAYDEFLMDY